MGLQRGVVQGDIASVSSYMDRKYYEVAPHFIVLPGISEIFSAIVMNKDSFNKLPPAKQKIILDASQVIEEKSISVAEKVC